MPGADGGGGLGARLGRQWDVALSFAGAQRDYVGQVAASLKAQGVRCFYDADEQVRLWGTHLAEELPGIYARESAAVVVFVSADYAERDWTRLERRAAFSRAVIEAGIHVLPARFDDTELPGLLPDVVAVDLRCYTPAQFADLVVTKLADLAINPSPPRGGADGGPPGGVRVAEADPRRLGVHAAISVPGVPDEIPPGYVPRDADTAEFGVRAKVAAAAQRGGFVLLVGGSSVGKTRCAVEAVKAVLPDWWLVHPAGSIEVPALAAAPLRMVVWLDELQRYLDGKDGLTGAMVRALLNSPQPVVIIGTLWPDRYFAYTIPPTPGCDDPHAREREVLDLADVVRIDPDFSNAEQERARAAAASDRRLAVALESAGYGLTQTLAAAPQLIARWQDAKTASPYAWSVLTAALDVARLGAHAPLSSDLLRAAAVDYCTSQQQAEAPENWFEQAMAYATSKLHGAAAALSPTGAGMGQVIGYTVADYLIQHATWERRSARVPTSTWDAAFSHIRDPADAARLAASASNRLLYLYAIQLYRYAADAGDEAAASPLAKLLARRGDLDELQARADARDWFAAEQLAELLAKSRDLNGLQARVDIGDSYATLRLARLLIEHGDLDGAEQILRVQADAGHGEAAWRLDQLLAERGDLDQLCARADVGDTAAAWRLDQLLAERGDLDGLRARADAGDGNAADRVEELLAERGDLDGLRARADADVFGAVERLPRHGLNSVRIQVNTSALSARARLNELLAERGDLDGLRVRAREGDSVAAWRLAGLLAERGDLDGLRAWADEGYRYAAQLLAGLLAERGTWTVCAPGPTLTTGMLPSGWPRY